MKKRHILIAAALVVLVVGTASAYTYTIWKDDLPTFRAPSYDTIVPSDSLLRSMPGDYGGCGFSPNNCTQVGTIPEPSSYALFGLGLSILIWRVRHA